MQPGDSLVWARILEAVSRHLLCYMQVEAFHTCSASCSLDGNNRRPCIAEDLPRTVQESRPPLTERIKEAIGLKSHPPVPEVSCCGLIKPTWEPRSALRCLSMHAETALHEGGNADQEGFVLC